MTRGDRRNAITFDTAAVAWRGPAPFVFGAVPSEHVAAVRAAARSASYGWGVVPVASEIDGVAFTTSLVPRDGGYLLPLKAAVRARTGIAVGDRFRVTMAVVPRDRPGAKK